MSEQQRQATTTSPQADHRSVCPHPEAVGKRWGDPISVERQTELKVLADKQRERATQAASHAGSNFDGVALTGADVFWLATYALAGPDALADAFTAAQLRLSTPTLSDPARVWPGVPQLNLEGASAIGAHLEGAALAEAHLEGSNLWLAHLEGASLRSTHLEGASLYNAHLEAAYLVGAHLEGTNLSGAYMDNSTVLRDATLIGTKVVDIRWGGANWGGINLSTMAPTLAPPLGEEDLARKWKPEPLRTDPTKPRPTRAERRAHRAKQRAEGIRLYQAAVRANRQLAVTLRSQGLNEDADRFAYRAQVCQRTVLRRTGQGGAWLLQSLLAVVAGYGYRLWRIFAAYVLIVALFAAGFLASGVVSSHVGPTAPQVFDALQISLNAIHGRVFFAQFHLDTLQSWLATAESIIGIVIEGVFVAMLVQRFFGSK